MIRKYILLVFFALGAIVEIWAQSINGSTPAPTVPFGSNTSYPGTATLPTNLPTTGAYGSSTDAANAYNYWKTTYVRACGTTQYRVLFDDGTSTVSEGIGYGMLLTAYAGDKATFDGLWAYYKANADANGLMNWKIGGCTGASGTMGATDGDEDAAMALLVAAYQWPTATTPYVYKTEANTLITAINKCEIDTKTTPQYQPSNGDGWINCNSTSNTCRNPSYMAPAYYKCFAFSSDVTSIQSVSWTSVAGAAQTLVLANVNANSGLVTNWSDQNGVENGCNGPANQYGYDACRNPWRMAVDVAWYGDAWAQTICSNIAKECQAAGAANVSGVVAPTGPITGGTHDATFVSTFMAGCVGATTAYQATINSMYTEAVNTTDTPPLYFGNTLKTLALFLATGNFWSPCNMAPKCSKPSLGPDQSLCGTTGTITLNSGLTAQTYRTFHWYNNSAPTTQLNTNTSQTTLAVTTAGKYFVTVDSSTCSQTDTINITSTLPVPNIGTKDTLCTTTSYNLTPSNLASFPAGTTWQWLEGGSKITGETNSTLSDVRTAGTYQLIASIAGCPSDTGSVTITSDLPTPVDGCTSSGGTATLSITPQAGHTGDTYGWYASASASGTPITTGTTYSPSGITSTTTYYVKDMSTISAKVGRTSTTVSNSGGVGSNLGLNFTAYSNFTLNTVDIPIIYYNGGVGESITIELLNSSGTVITSASPTIPSGPTAGGLEMVTVNLGFSITGSSSSPAPYTLVISAHSGSAGISLENTGTFAYPYKDNSATPGSIVQITSADNYGTNSTSEYVYFYNWNISTGTTCNALPVIADIGGCTAQPVRLAGFNLVNNGSSVSLYWATASEVNNNYFNVERSRDGYDFEAIGQVKGNGTSEIGHTYSFIDESPIIGTGYYRLAQYDYDGAIEYSATLSTSTEDKTLVTVAPNPFTHQTSILISDSQKEAVQIKVLDLTGKLLYTGNYYTNETITLGSEFNVGLYIVQVQINDRVYVQKMIKQ